MGQPTFWSRLSSNLNALPGTCLTFNGLYLSTGFAVILADILPIWPNVNPFLHDIVRFAFTPFDFWVTSLCQTQCVLFCVLHSIIYVALVQFCFVCTIASSRSYCVYWQYSNTCKQQLFLIIMSFTSLILLNSQQNKINNFISSYRMFLIKLKF